MGKLLEFWRGGGGWRLYSVLLCTANGACESGYLWSYRPVNQELRGGGGPISAAAQELWTGVGAANG